MKRADVYAAGGGDGAGGAGAARGEEVRGVKAAVRCDCPYGAAVELGTIRWGAGTLMRLLAKRMRRAARGEAVGRRLYWGKGVAEAA